MRLPRVAALSLAIGWLLCLPSAGVPESPLKLLGAQCPINVHGYTVAAVLRNPRWSSLTQDLDLADFWGGAGAITVAARARGYSAEIFDWTSNPQMDFFTEDGFCSAVDLAMRLRPGGCLAMGPTCSSFGFGPSSSTKRTSANFAGDPTNELAQKGNFEAQVSCFFLFLAVARGIHAWIEQPAGSMLFSYLEFALKLLPCLVAACAPRCFFSREPMGSRFFKKYKFLATGTWILQIVAACPCGDRGHRPLMTTSAEGKKTGLKVEMKESQVYPTALGEALVTAWQAAKVQGWPSIEAAQRPGVLEASPDLQPLPQQGFAHWLQAAPPEQPGPAQQKQGRPQQEPGPWAEQSHKLLKRRKCKSSSSAGPWAKNGETSSEGEAATPEAAASPWGQVAEPNHHQSSSSPWEEDSELSGPGPQGCNSVTATGPWS